MFKLKQGFTLVELLVVIAIIGILSSVAVVNLNSARNKAVQAAITGYLGQMQSQVLLCLDGGNELNCHNLGGPPADLCNDDNTVPDDFSEAVPICDGSNVYWQDIPTNYGGYGWQYLNGFFSDATAGTWQIGAENTDGTTITCTESGCITTNP